MVRFVQFLVWVHPNTQVPVGATRQRVAVNPAQIVALVEQDHNSCRVWYAGDESASFRVSGSYDEVMARLEGRLQEDEANG